MESTVPSTAAPEGVRVRGPEVADEARVLTPAALAFVAGLVRTFGPRIDAALEARGGRQAAWDAGEPLDFAPETREIRDAPWTVAPIPADLQDRRVEITGPVDRKMIINALNSGASVFMADFEDATSPTWTSVVSGQANLQDAVAGTIAWDDPGSGKSYRLAERTATLMVRPRGWHLTERHLEVDGRPAPAALVDFGLFFFHCARALVARGSGPYFYLPKLQHPSEARLWNDVFLHAQREVGLPAGTVRATVLVETLPAAFAMDEILWELRDHSAGLNCGRWDYIFSFIKTRRADPAAVLPDRAQVTMEQPCMRAYTQLVVRTCHRRGVHAMGGMAAQIPLRGDAEASRVALERVRADKLREVRDGHDGTWVAHPGLVPVARQIFDEGMTGPNQLARLREDVRVTAGDLLEVPQGTRTEHGLRWNVRVGVQYLEAWLRGIGCVPLYHLMEDAATAEICRTQVWQWRRHAATLDDGRTVDGPLVDAVVAEELSALHAAAPPGHRFDEAAELFAAVSTGDTPVDFLTLPAYELLLGLEEGSAGSRRA